MRKFARTGGRSNRHFRRHHRLHSEKYYYEERARTHRVAHEQAAQFIYLNRTCWNGLYRVNLRGEFNVPIGTKSSVTLETDDFKRISSQLKRATLTHSDFSHTINEAKRGDFLFIDPPYVTRHNFNGFVKYNDNIFSWNDQERLADCVVAAASRGAKNFANQRGSCVRAKPISWRWCTSFCEPAFRSSR